MKRAFLWLFLVAFTFQVFGQGTIYFANRLVPTRTSDANYNIPVRRCTSESIGGGYVAGLYEVGASEPFVKTLFRTDLNGQFFLSPQIAVVPGGVPGASGPGNSNHRPHRRALHGPQI